jgi:hypothetical protein
MGLTSAVTPAGFECAKRGTDSSTDNILTTYLIFDERLDQDITIKVISEAGQEYGRATEHISGQKGDAKYFDFFFDKRTNIDGRELDFATLPENIRRYISCLNVANPAGALTEANVVYMAMGQEDKAADLRR